MKDLVKTEFFSLQIEHTQEITNQQIQCAYGKFIAHIDILSQENDLISIVRKLNITHAELVFLSAPIQHEQKKMYINFATLTKLCLMLIPSYHLPN